MLLFEKPSETEIVLLYLHCQSIIPSPDSLGIWNCCTVWLMGVAENAFQYYQRLVNQLTTWSSFKTLHAGKELKLKHIILTCLWICTTRAGYNLGDYLVALARISYYINIIIT